MPKIEHHKGKKDAFWDSSQQLLQKQEKNVTKKRWILEIIYAEFQISDSNKPGCQRLLKE